MDILPKIADVVQSLAKDLSPTFRFIIIILLILLMTVIILITPQINSISPLISLIIILSLMIFVIVLLYSLNIVKREGEGMPKDDPNSLINYSDCIENHLANEEELKDFTMLLLPPSELTYFKRPVQLAKAITSNPELKQRFLELAKKRKPSLATCIEQVASNKEDSKEL